MAAKIQPRMVLLLFCVFISAVPICFCQSNSPQNIQAFYPFPLPPIARTPTSPYNQSLPPSPTPSRLSEPPPPPPPPPPLPSQPGKSFSKEAFVKAVVVTAASTFVLSGLLFFLLQRCSRGRKAKGNRTNPYSGDRVVPHNEFPRFNGNFRGLGVDEVGLDVVYWRNLEGKNINNNFNKEEEKRKKSEPPKQEFPLLRGKSSTSHNQVLPEVEKQDSSIQNTTRSPPPPPPPPTPVLAAPPIPAKKSPAPPTDAPGLASSSKLPAAPKGMSSNEKQGEFSSGEGMNGEVKLKPLHWDKVNPNADHSMVRHKIDGGSFRFDGDLMEALFGYVATNRKSPQRNSKSLSNPASQVFILDGQKSQNSAIVLRSIAISRKDIIEALLKGQGLNAETLEKLTKIAPTKDEESEILAFDGDPTRLADAESFLYHLLRAVPSAFTLFSAMLFRSSYDSEILHLKETLKTLELGCKELRTRGLFLKLLEAILKAGNHMNAGTSRGNAQAFNLTALRKLSDVKSIDGKTTLLHFVVEEVVRAEGKSCFVNRNRSLSRSSSQNSDNSISKDDRDREYIMLGLPVLGGFSAEFANVKKAATIDSDAFAKICSALTARIAEIQRLLTQCGNAGGGGFLREMRSFLEAAEEEVNTVTEEQTRVMELVKRTTENYQAGASKNKEKHTLQLFVIVKDFLGMVDQVCIDIARNLRKRRTATTNVGSSQPKSLATRIAVRFPILPENFMSEEASLQE